MDEKYCKHCDNIKPVDEFRYRKDGDVYYYVSRCILCEKEYDIARRAKKKKVKTEDKVENIVISDVHPVSEVIMKYGVDLDTFANALMKQAKHDITQLTTIEERFYWNAFENSKSLADELHITFDDINKRATEILRDVHGMRYPEDVGFSEGKYLVISDTRGKNTKHEMFDLINTLNENLDIDNVIHIGHILDDDNVISYRVKDIDNLVVVAKQEEVSTISSVVDDETNDLDFTVIRNQVKLGNLIIKNQDMLTNEYIKGGVKNLDPKIYTESCIVNLHKHELTSITSERGINTIVMSTGCMCEKHVIKTIRTIDWVNKTGKKTNISYAHSYSTYRRKGELKEFWEQGLYIVEVDSVGNWQATPCRVNDIDTGERKVKACVYFDKVYTSEGVFNPDAKSVLVTDIHAPMHCDRTLSIIENVVADFTPDTVINMGDFLANKAMNHHAMSRGEVATYANEDFLAEMATGEHVMARTRKWASSYIYMLGNHDTPFIDKALLLKYPQLKTLIDIPTLLRLDEHKVDVIDNLSIMRYGNSKYSHGDMRIFGTGGTPMDKFAIVGKTVGGKPLAIGHVHAPRIKNNVYIIPMAGKLNQEYNEVNASGWCNGFGLVVTYNGVDFISPVIIQNERVTFNGKVFVPNDNSHGEWNVKNKKFRVTYY